MGNVHLKCIEKWLHVFCNIKRPCVASHLINRIRLIVSLEFICQFPGVALGWHWDWKQIPLVSQMEAIPFLLRVLPCLLPHSEGPSAQGSPWSLPGKLSHEVSDQVLIPIGLPHSYISPFPSFLIMKPENLNPMLWKSISGWLPAFSLGISRSWISFHSCHLILLKCSDLLRGETLFENSIAGRSEAIYHMLKKLGKISE